MSASSVVSLALQGFLALALPTLACAQTRDPYKSEVGTLADRIAHDVVAERKENPSAKVVVLDFGSGGRITLLGERLSNDLSDALTERLTAEQVVTRQHLREHLRAAGISPWDLLDKDAAIYNAGEAGASLVVTGELGSSPHEIILHVALLRVSDGMELSTASSEFSPSEELKNLNATFLDWPKDPGLVVPCSGHKQSDSQIAFGAAGVLQAKCVRCMPPSFTDAARAVKYQGSVAMNVVIDENGKVQAVTIVKGDPYGLAAAGIKTIKEWTFEPATKDGCPCVFVSLSR